MTIYFSTNSIVEFATNEPTLNLSRRFSSSNASSFSLDAQLNIIGNSNVPVSNKKMQYLIDSLVSDNLKNNYPLYVDFIKSYLKFIDMTTIKTTVNFNNNNNLHTVYNEFIDFYVNDYFNDVIDFDKYNLSNENKKKLLHVSRILNNLKGNKKAFDFLFRVLTNIRIAQEDGIIDVDKIIIEYIEDETWWTGGLIKYFDGTYICDGSIDASADFARPFTYQFKVNQTLETMLPLIKSVHPAGFLYEFIYEAIFSDVTQPVDIIYMNETYYHFFNGFYSCNGEITASGFHELESSF